MALIDSDAGLMLSLHASTSALVKKVMEFREHDQLVSYVYSLAKDLEWSEKHTMTTLALLLLTRSEDWRQNITRFFGGSPPS